MMVGGPVGRAKLALANGRADEAERICRKVLERRPDDSNARLVLAQALLQSQQVVEAIEQVRRVIREQPKNVDAHLILSAALVQRGGVRVPAEAEQVARRATQLQPRAARTHVQLAEVLAAQRDLKGARAQVDEAIRLEPRLAGAHLMRALILLSDKDPLGAIQSSDTALRYDRTLTQAEFIRANALTEVKRYDDALSALDAAMRGNPLLGGSQTSSLRGRIYFKQRKYKQSYAQYLIAQRMTGRLLRLAPVLAGLNMALSVFGSRAPYVLTALITVLVMLILFGIGHIPLAGPWIVVALVLALVGFAAFTGLRQLQGSIVPADHLERLTTVAAMGVSGLAGLVLVLAIARAVATGMLHVSTSQWFGPLPLTIAGVIAIALATLAAYFFPRVLGRAGSTARA